MNPKESWKSFKLGDELSIAGVFIYNGLRRFNEMAALDYEDEIFEVLYNLSVGLERLLKIAVVFVEDQIWSDQEELERSLITHSHLDLLARIRKQIDLRLDTAHNDLLSLLGSFYKSYRYGRFSLASVYNPNNEKDALWQMLSKHLHIDLKTNVSIFVTPNDPRCRKHLNRLVKRIAEELYAVIVDRAGKLNVYPYELRPFSKAYTIFRAPDDSDFYRREEVTWKELLIYFMNTKDESELLGYLRAIEPLELDPALAQDYLACFRSDSAKSAVADEVESIYEEFEKPGERLERLDLIANPMVDFS